MREAADTHSTAMRPSYNLPSPAIIKRCSQTAVLVSNTAVPVWIATCAHLSAHRCAIIMRAGCAIGTHCQPFAGALPVRSERHMHATHAHHHHVQALCRWYRSRPGCWRSACVIRMLLERIQRLCGCYKSPFAGALPVQSAHCCSCFQGLCSGHRLPPVCRRAACAICTLLQLFQGLCSGHRSPPICRRAACAICTLLHSPCCQQTHAPSCAAVVWLVQIATSLPARCLCSEHRLCSRCCGRSDGCAVRRSVLGACSRTAGWSAAALRWGCCAGLRAGLHHGCACHLWTLRAAQMLQTTRQKCMFMCGVMQPVAAADMAQQAVPSNTH